MSKQQQHDQARAKELASGAPLSSAFSATFFANTSDIQESDRGGQIRNVSAVVANQNPPHTTQQFSQQEQHLQQDPAFMHTQSNFNPTTHSTTSYANDIFRTYGIQNSNVASFMAMLPHRRQVTGVDKLILAAMMDESAATAQQQVAPAPTSIYSPCGRGIGYNDDMRDLAQQIPVPSNKSELELYNLLEKANLLSYFGTFLNFGGDDVQQLSDADEEEFLEIMSLVGMTQKPLHVRRLQKALIEWRESKEMDKSFRAAYHTNLHRPNTRGFNDKTQSMMNNSLDESQLESTISNALVSPAATPTSTSSNSTIVVTIDSNTGPVAGGQDPNPIQSVQYASPREILVGAPKRPRLLVPTEPKAAEPEELRTKIKSCEHQCVGRTKEVSPKK